jgi:hypothetical protein
MKFEIEGREPTEPIIKLQIAKSQNENCFLFCGNEFIIATVTTDGTVHLNKSGCEQLGLTITS